MSLSGLSALSAKRNLTSLSSLHISSTTARLSVLKKDAPKEYVLPYAYWETWLMQKRDKSLRPSRPWKSEITNHWSLLNEILLYMSPRSVLIMASTVTAIWVTLWFLVYRIIVLLI